MSEGLEATVIFLLQLPLSTQFNTASFNQKGNEIHYSLSLFLFLLVISPYFLLILTQFFSSPFLLKSLKKKKTFMSLKDGSVSNVTH